MPIVDTKQSSNVHKSAISWIKICVRATHRFFNFHINWTTIVGAFFLYALLSFTHFGLQNDCTHFITRFILMRSGVDKIPLMLRHMQNTRWIKMTLLIIGDSTPLSTRAHKQQKKAWGKRIYRIRLFCGICYSLSLRAKSMILLTSVEKHVFFILTHYCS